jgi:hypothetical protein
MSYREKETERDRCNREELVERMARGIPIDGRIEPFKRLFLARSSVPTEPVFGLVEPSFCVIAQGRKEMHLGDKLPSRLPGTSRGTPSSGGVHGPALSGASLEPRSQAGRLGSGGVGPLTAESRGCASH